MSTAYDAWKMKFAYAQQKTVIDVACEIVVGNDESTIEKPKFCGMPLQTCDHDNPCESLGDHNDHLK